MASAEPNSSRFNPFKFNSKPPPLPPKDPIYLRSSPAPTTAFVGDNTTTTTAPSSPISPTIQYAIRRANSPSPFSSAENNHVFATNMNYSASSLLSPPPSSQPQQVQRQDSTSSSKHSHGNSRHISTTSSKKDKALAFLKFPKRSPRSPPLPQAGPLHLGSSIDSVMVIGSDEGEDVPPPPQEDDNISLPWNFQHNIHVDDGYVGMPPSWSTSLASAGFTEEEISRIHARREMGVRSPPDLRYLYNERPRSPAATAAFPPGYANPNQPPQPFGLPATPAPGPVLTHPTPRTTSLPRGTTPVDQPPNAQQKPVLPSLQTTKPTLPANPAALSNPVKIAGASTAVATPTSLVLGAGDPRRAPPPKPKRKAPSPYEPYDAEGTTRVNQHRQNQPSSSTVGASTSDSHGYGSGYDASGSQNHDTTNDGSYYNDPTFNTSSLSLQTRSTTELEDDDDDTPLALRPLRLGSESAASVASSSSQSVGGGARKKRKNNSNNNGKFRVVNGDPRQRKRNSRSGSRNRSDSESVLSSLSRAQRRRSVSRTRTTGEEDEGVDLNSVDMGHHGRGGAGASRSRSGERDRDRDTITPGMSAAAMQMAMAGSTAATAATTATPTTNPMTTTAPVENEKKKGKSSIWGTKITSNNKPIFNASASTSNLASTSFPNNNAFASTSSTTLPLAASTSYAASGSSSDAAPSLSFSSNANAAQQQQQPGWKSTTTALASSVAAKSSSLAGGVVRQSNNLVEAVRVSAGRGVAKMKSGSSKTAKKNGKGGLSGLLGGSTQAVDAEEEEEEEGGLGDADSDEEFVSLTQERRPAVWELYTRPSQAALEELEAANASKTSLGSVGDKDLTTTKTAIVPLRRQPSSGAKSIRSQGSQGSLHSGNQSSTSLALGKSGSGNGNNLIYNLKASQSTGSLLSLTRKRGHTKNSGSMTSLESIPEVGSPPPLLPGPSSYNRTAPPTTQTNGVPSAGSSGGSGSGGPPVTSRTKKAPALPPRLSLHQADSSDLSLWSEALISGISLSGDGDLGLSFGLTPDKGKGKEKEKGKGPMTTAKPLAQAPPTQPRFQAPAPSVQPQPQPLPLPLPQKKSAPSNRPTAALRKAGQPLPSSKPPPSRPIPPIVHPAVTSTATGTATGGRSIDQKSGSGSGSAAMANGASSKSGLGASASSSVLGSNANNNYSPAPMSGVAEAATSARFMPVTPAPFSPAVFSPPPALADKTLPLLVDVDATGGVGSPMVMRKPPAPPTTTTVSQGNGLLSPPPTAWSTTADPAFSPSGGSSAGPDSAQLWNEIEQMMDPTMMSAIPGLNFGVALPPGAQGVLRSAGVMVPSALPLPPVGVGANVEGGEGGMRTVGDLVGTSPVYSAAATQGEERGRGRQQQQQQQIQEEDEGVDDGDGGSMYGDEDPYDGYRTIRDIDPPTLPADIPPVPVIVRAPSPDSRLLSVSSSREPEESDDHRDVNPNRDSSRSSTSTLIATLHPITIVRTASVARRAGAYVVDNSKLEQSRERARVASNASAASATSTTSVVPAFVGNTLGSTSTTTATAIPSPTDSAKSPPSPSLSAYFGGGGSSEESGSSSSMSHEQPTMTDTPTTDGGLASPLTYYLDGTQTPSPTPDKVVFGGGVQTMPIKRLPVRPEYDGDLEEEEFMGYPDEDSAEAKAAIARAQAVATTPPAARPTIVISSDTVSPLLSDNPPWLSAASTASPLSPFQRYRGWLSAVVAPLEEFIDEAVDPREHYLDLQEIAEGESGSVFAAVLNSSTAHKLRLPPLVKAKDADEILHGRTVLVAIKSVAIVPSGSPKLVDLQRELGLMRGLGLGHENVLGMDGVYVDLVEDSLWVRMELMERSLADIIGLAGDGLQLQERTIARFASDVLCALEYLQKHNIAHRDVRSDNLLLNKHGVLKLADFSNAIQVTRESSMRDDIVGVPFWQAPEVRRPPYDALKVDVWSLGATVWEMAQQDPPFADTQQLAERWPPLRQPDLFSPAFHDFLRKCSEPAAVRPNPGEMLKSSFITHKACGRQVVVLLLTQCMAIEKHLQEGNGVPSP